MSAESERRRGLTARQGGILLLPLVFAASALGVASVGSPGQGLTELVAVHAAAGGVVVVAAAFVLAASSRFSDARARRVTRLTVLAIFLTATTGAIFLATDFAAGLNIDRTLGLLDLVGAGTMILVGDPPAR